MADEIRASGMTGLPRTSHGGLCAATVWLIPMYKCCHSSSPPIVREPSALVPLNPQGSFGSHVPIATRILVALP